MKAPIDPVAWRRGVVLLCWTAFLSSIVLAGCSRGPALSAEEKQALAALADYEPIHEVDDKQRVVQLKLEGKFVTDEALDEARKLRHLRGLSLHNSSVTDVGVAKLKELKRLETLGLVDTSVTDKGLSHLEKMPTLRHVWVNESEKLTAGGIESLKRALPGVGVHVMNRPAKTSAKGEGKGT